MRTLSELECFNAELFRDKPERITGFPQWPVSDAVRSAAEKDGRLAIVEIAGRDSIAAAIYAVMEKGFTDLLPVYVYTGTECGPWSNVTQAVKRLAGRLPETRVHDLCVMGSPVFWRALNGRYIRHMIDAYGGYTPCVGCHLYLHAARIPLATYLGGTPIISGERESHSGMVKINQTAPVLDFFEAFAERFGIRLLLPLRRIADGRAIETILDMDWKRGQEQLGCCLSGNYRDIDGAADTTAFDADGYLSTFAGPLAESVVTACLSGDVPDCLGIAGDLLESK